MRIWIASDLHLEFGRPFNHPPPKDVGVMVCAGDVLTKGIGPSVEWLADHVARAIPVVFVGGNHEFYGASVLESIKEARAFTARHSNIHFLENDVVNIGDVRFVGATLWTDFRLNGGDPELAMAAAETGMNDYRKIKLSKLPYRKFKPIHAYRKHHESRAFIKSALKECAARKTVVVTHHAPSGRSIPPEFRGDPLSACYASDLEDLIIEGRPALWVHGHVHQKVDYRIAESRVVANPRGYPGEGTAFDPQLVIEI
ncbi:metallophosphoesterase [Sinorhizobium meliloti]|uniref:metallophosphoesterase n=1 Tax=Rhizobium meliloti TaxID=382 RepID=UPI00299D9801|nr:phosphatase [Sinorhizobium meliloti]